MTKIPVIEIHGVDKNGTKYVLNHLTGDNTEVSGASPKDVEARLARLRTHAMNLLMRWQGYLPDDKLSVVEL